MEKRLKMLTKEISEVEKKRLYRVVNFKRKSRTFKEQGYLEGITETKRNTKGLRVEISKWRNHNKSFHITFKDFDGRYIIVDSGVIEQLAREIQYRKKNGLNKDIFDGLIVINHKGEFY
jgi:hypothetical protein